MPRLPLTLNDSGPIVKASCAISSKAPLRIEIAASPVALAKFRKLNEPERIATM